MADVRRALGYQELEQKHGLLSQQTGQGIALDDLEFTIGSPITITNDDSVLFRSIEAANRLADLMGVPKVEIRKVARGASAVASRPT